MEYASISAKLPRDEISLFKKYCEKEGITPSAMIRKLISREINSLTLPYVAGKNLIQYNKENDKFKWLVELDTCEKLNVLEEVDLNFLKDLDKQIENAFKYRLWVLSKQKNKSVAVPRKFL